MINSKEMANAFWFVFVMVVLAASASCLGAEPSSATEGREASMEALLEAISGLQKQIGELQDTVDRNEAKRELESGKYRPVISSTKPRVVADPEKFKAYQDRLAARRSKALAIRRAHNAGKNHVYWRFNPWSLSPFWSAIEQGWVRQPPIPSPGGGGRRPCRPEYVPNHY